MKVSVSNLANDCMQRCRNEIEWLAKHKDTWMDRESFLRMLRSWASQFHEAYRAYWSNTPLIDVDEKARRPREAVA